VATTCQDLPRCHVTRQPAATHPLRCLRTRRAPTSTSVAYRLAVSNSYAPTTRPPTAADLHVERLQLELAVELLSDVGKHVENTIVEDYLQRRQPLGDLVKSVLARNQISKPRRSRGDAKSRLSVSRPFPE
jgi:hypothetical protein